MLLVVAAYAPELASLPPSCTTRAVGIGLVAAAHGTALAIASLRPTHVLLVGTAGAYPERGVDLGDAIVGTRSVLASTSVAHGTGAWVADTGAAIPLEPAGADALGAKPAVIGTTLAITTDDVLASDLAQASGADVEHLETHAVAHACRAAGVPLTVLLGVTNAVGARGRAEWLEHRAQVEVATQRLAERWIALRNPS